MNDRPVRVACVTHHRCPTAQEIRATKFGAVVHEMGGRFFILCPGDAGQPRTEEFASGRIIRLRPTSSRIWSRLLVAVLPVNPIWVYWLWRQLTELQCDLVIVRDLRLAVPTILAARHCRKRVILDLGEHYPGMMEILGKTSLAHHVMRNHWLITLLEAASVALADVVWVVVDENRERLLRYNSRMHVVNNYPAGVIDLQGRHPAHRPYSERGDAVRIISFGLMDNIRGLDLAVDALAVAVESLPNLELAFYGDGPFRPVVEERVAALGLQSKVKFFGWTDAAHRSDALLSGDIGIILHRVCDLTNHTLPNKLFDYMSVGLPILATKMVPVCRIMEREKCGLAADETPAAVAQLLRTLVLDAELRRALGANGRRAALMHYRWETEAGIVASDILSCIEVSRHGRHAS